MPVAVVLRLDEISARQVEALIETLPDQCVVRRRPPHIRLATYDDGVDVARLDEALAQAVRMWTKVSVSLAGIGVFPGEPSILWMAPTPIHDSMRWHLAVNEALVDVAGRHSYEFGIWTPYVVLGHSAYPADSIEVLTTAWEGPIEATLDRIEIVRLEPFLVLASRMLRD